MRAVIAYIGLGSNLGDRLRLLRAAARRLARVPGVRVVRSSPVYETEPWGPITRQPRFLNAVCEIATTQSPPALMQHLVAIERALGRVRVQPQGPRAIDLDLLLYGDAVVREPTLVVPHPRLTERSFVLVPLGELAPRLRHPVLGVPVAELRDRLGSEGVIRVAARAVVPGGRGTSGRSRSTPARPRLPGRSGQSGQ